MVADSGGGDVVMTIELTRPTGWRLRMMDGPPRVVLELNDFHWDGAPALKTGSVAALEVLETGPSRSELHAVLREPLSVISAEMAVADSGGAVLTVRMKPTTGELFQTELDDATAAIPSHPRTVVAIDPGHGGTDPGAESGDIREAALVLEFAERLRDILVASGRFDVVLTRSDDSLVSLDARLTRAREGEADIFLSLHADALAGTEEASGIVLYRLSPDAQAEANQRLNERHAPDDRLNGVDLKDAGEDVSLALFDLARQSTGPRTRALSSALLAAFEGAGMVVNTRPERTADFAVLKAADIPSLLVELGFLSTEEDLQRLTSEDWQTTAATALRDGLILWADEDRLR